jgi:phenylpropionate dioxygenase-like ring-hydroxylating dioxygenase large terminal subunit
MPFLQNTWYLAAWADELASDKMLARTIVDRPLICFRDQAGQASVLEDRCPHRFAPLSRGKLDAGVVTCGYHGLSFDSKGRCVRNPHGPIPPAVKVSRLPVCERHFCIWIWPGEPDRADETLIPDLGFIDRVSAQERVKGHLETQSNYQLMIDNIMDLSHADYLHPQTLGGGINTRAKCEVAESVNEVAVKWTALNDTLPPAMAQFLPNPQAPGDFQNEVYWNAPGIMRQRVAFAEHGRLQTHGFESWTSHVMTPRTSGSTHYFYCHTNAALQQNPEMAPQIDAVLRSAFQGEDAPMLEAQQGQIGDHDFWDLKPALLSIDKAAVLARRHLEKLIKAEASSSP